MIPLSPGLGKVRVALGEEAWHRSLGTGYWGSRVGLEGRVAMGS